MRNAIAPGNQSEKPMDKVDRDALSVIAAALVGEEVVIVASTSEHAEMVFDRIREILSVEGLKMENEERRWSSP